MAYLTHTHRPASRKQTAGAAGIMVVSERNRETAKDGPVPYKRKPGPWPMTTSPTNKNRRGTAHRSEKQLSIARLVRPASSAHVGTQVGQALMESYTQDTDFAQLRLSLEAEKDKELDIAYRKSTKKTAYVIQGPRLQGTAKFICRSVSGQ